MTMSSSGARVWKDGIRDIEIPKGVYRYTTYEGWCVTANKSRRARSFADCKLGGPTNALKAAIAYVKAYPTKEIKFCLYPDITLPVNIREQYVGDRIYLEYKKKNVCKRVPVGNQWAIAKTDYLQALEQLIEKASDTHCANVAT